MECLDSFATNTPRSSRGIDPALFLPRALSRDGSRNELDDRDAQRKHEVAETSPSDPEVSIELEHLGGWIYWKEDAYADPDRYITWLVFVNHYWCLCLSNVAA